MKEEPTYTISFIFRRVLVPIDLSERSKLAIDFAIDLAERYGSKITFLYVLNPEEDDRVVEEIRKRVDQIASRRGIPYEFKVRRRGTESSVAYEIVREIKEGMYDAVILASRGYVGEDALLLHSTSVNVAICAPCTVVILR